MEPSTCRRFVVASPRWLVFYLFEGGRPRSTRASCRRLFYLLFILLPPPASACTTVATVYSCHERSCLPVQRGVCRLGSCIRSPDMVRTPGSLPRPLAGAHSGAHVPLGCASSAHCKRLARRRWAATARAGHPCHARICAASAWCDDSARVAQPRRARVAVRARTGGGRCARRAWPQPPARPGAPSQLYLSHVSWRGSVFWRCGTRAQTPDAAYCLQPDSPLRRRCLAHP